MREHDRKELWYQSPARYWEEALPLGNGRLGAMMFSGTEEDVLMINEDTLWSGYPKDTNIPGAYPHYVKARDLALDKRYEEAEREIEEHLLGEFTDSYLPVGDIRLHFPELAGKEVTDYERSLRLTSAESGSSFQCGGVRYEKEAFISVPEQALYLKLSTDRKGALSFSVSVGSLLRSECAVMKNRLLLTGIAPSYVAPSYLVEDDPVIYGDDDSHKGMRFSMMVSVETDGEVRAELNHLNVKCAGEAVIRVCVRTSFRGFDKHPFIEGRDETGLCLRDMEHAEGVNFEKARERHKKEYGELFDRMDLQLESRDLKYREMPTDERVRRFYPEGGDPGLCELLFHYGRYLLIASSRPGTQPANLQGIWNARVRPPWSSNFTLNINTEMNYWPAESCNLSPLHEPLFDLIRELRVTGSQTARILYGARGFVAHHNTDIWRLSTPVGRKGKGTAGYAFWPMSAGWLCRHLYEHYEYTMDEAFLRNTAYPLIREAALFYSDVLVENGEGLLVFAPSTSPENRYIKDGFRGAAAESTAMGMAIIREVFTECIRGSGILGVRDSVTEDLQRKLKLLKPLQIGEDGRILEWNEPVEEANPLHRHISHVYALHPGNLVSCERGQEQRQAFRKTLEGRGDAGTGWSLSWKMNAWARLGDGEHAGKLLKEQLKYVEPGDTEENSNNFNYEDGGGVYPNLFDAHPPFQIDGNFGVVAGIGEMLLQSTETEIILLPALPPDFSVGRVKGICARGRVWADFAFRDGKLSEAVLYTDRSQDRTVVYQGKRQEIHLDENVPFVFL